MRRSIFVLLLIISATLAFAQAPSKYIVWFTDKAASPFSTSNPSQYLSQRAIERRSAQAIAVVQNDLPVNPAYIGSVLSSGQVTLLNRSKWLNAISIHTSDSNALAVIQAYPFVSTVQPVKFRASQASQKLAQQQAEPNSHRAFLRDESGLDYGPSFRQVSQLGGDCMHNMGYTGKGKVIAVLDAGFENVNLLPTFDSIRNDGRILGTWDFVANEASVYEDHSHGTMVLSCIGANLPGQIIGTAPGASFWLLRTEDAGSEYVIEEFNWVAGAEFADSVGSDVINSSLGYTVFDDPSQNHSYSDLDGNTTIITRGADLAASKGIVVVNSAGNEGSSPWHYISAPADGDSVLTVGAVDEEGDHGGFSSYGPTADGRIKPDVAARGVQTIIMAPSGELIAGNGTSFSAPLMSGMVATLWQAHPARTAREIYNAIIQSGHKYTNPDNAVGYGIPDFCRAHVLLGGTDPNGSLEEGAMKVFPNPFNDSFGFTFFSGSDQPVSIELYDAVGRKLMIETRELAEGSNSHYSVDMPGFTKGIYLLVVRTAQKKYVRKVIKW